MKVAPKPKSDGHFFGCWPWLVASRSFGTTRSAMPDVSVGRTMVFSLEAVSKP